MTDGFIVSSFYKVKRPIFHAEGIPSFHPIPNVSNQHCQVRIVYKVARSLFALDGHIVKQWCWMRIACGCFVFERQTQVLDAVRSEQSVDARSVLLQRTRGPLPHDHRTQRVRAHLPRRLGPLQHSVRLSVQTQRHSSRNKTHRNKKTKQNKTRYKTAPASGNCIAEPTTAMIAGGGAGPEGKGSTGGRGRIDRIAT